MLQVSQRGETNVADSHEGRNNIVQDSRRNVVPFDFYGAPAAIKTTKQMHRQEGNAKPTQAHCDNFFVSQSW